jgi:uroporphyrinogen decarboxylase
MTHRERFMATINNEPVDRPASWIGLPVPSAESGLEKFFGVKSMHELKLKLNDDIYPVEVPYYFPPANHIACAFNFAKSAFMGRPDERTLTTPGFFEDLTDPVDVDKFDWPDPSLYIDRDEARRRAREISDSYCRMGIMWSAHFQDACSAFGMEQALVTMMVNPDMFRAVIDRITKFYLRAGEVFYEATRGHLDAVLIGNDFGGQKGLMVDRESLQQYVFPGTRLLIDQAKSYGLKVMHHSCGSVFPLIPDLIGMGVDIIHPLQALAADMSVENMHQHFAGKVAFCGGIDAQYLLVDGKPEEIKKRVQQVKALFPTGMVISASHEAILPDIPPENLKAMFETINEVL